MPRLLTNNLLPLLSVGSLLSCVSGTTSEVRDATVTPYFEYHANARSRLHGFMQDGLRTGTWRAFNDSGNINWQANYRAGQLHGRFTAWKHAQKTMEGNYHKGHRTGLWVTWSGRKLHSEGHYNRGAATGRWTYYHANGRRSATGLMKDDKQHGSWTYWKEDGSLDGDLSGIYENGARVAPNKN